MCLYKKKTNGKYIERMIFTIKSSKDTENVVWQCLELLSIKNTIVNPATGKPRCG